MSTYLTLGSNVWNVTLSGDVAYYNRDGFDPPLFRVRSGVMEVSDTKEEGFTWRVSYVQGTFTDVFPIPMRLFLRSPVTP